jgi:hypothetical protein
MKAPIATAMQAFIRLDQHHDDYASIRTVVNPASLREEIFERLIYLPIPSTVLLIPLR